MSEPLPRFVADHRATWERLDALVQDLERKRISLEALEEMNRLYRRVAADLARAQSFYAGTDAHRYLNALCARAYGAIYSPPRDRLARTRTFFASGFPRTVRANAPYLWASAGLFVLGLAMGALVVWLEPRGAELLVPETVRTSVAHHEMWTDSLLSTAPPSFHASWIATNNLTVTLMTFAGGIFLGLGTLLLLLSNGLQIGAVVALCLREGMGFAAFSFMGAHGPVELSTIVLAGAAGLMVGHALLDPGELPRSESLRRRGVEAVQLVVGCAPFLAGVGVIEGFVSPGSLFPGAAKIALGLVLGAGFWAYLLRAGSVAGPAAASASARRAAR